MGLRVFGTAGSDAGARATHEAGAHEVFDHGQDGYAKEDDKSIDWETGRAAKADNNLSQYANNKKVCPGQ